MLSGAEWIMFNPGWHDELAIRAESLKKMVLGEGSSPSQGRQAPLE